MAKPGSALEVTTRIVRYDVKIIRQGQMLVPISMLATIAIRYVTHPAVWVVAGLAQLAAVLTFVRARRSFGTQSLRMQKDELLFGEGPGQMISRAGIKDWTFAERRARLYGANESWKLDSALGSGDQLNELLSQVFGPPRQLFERGSRRAQYIAGTIALIGLAVLVAGIVYEITPLGPIGMLGVLGGWSTHSFYKMKIAQKKSG